MPKGARNVATERVETVPLVSSRRGKFRTLEQCELEAEVHERLGEYKSFVREVEGEEPTVGAICSAALEMLFAADRAFAKSQETKRKNVRSESIANGATNANGSGTATHAAARAGNDQARKDAVAVS